ncbi:MAG TPA: hypothetical protein VJ978_10445, partial [Nitriliruptoraceae bacterium]|nr:hypothetical protein [Nitriliruptoraceae bacterium]
DQLRDLLLPEHVSPLVAWLCAQECTATGRTYSVGGGYIARVAIVEGAPLTFDDIPSVDDVAARAEALEALGPDPVEITQGVMEQTATIMQALGLDVPR